MTRRFMRSSVSCLHNESCSRGLSLLELLVVLVILAIGVTVAVPNLSLWIEKYTMWKARRQLVTDLQLAKMRAVSQGVQHRVSFDTATASYKIEQGDAARGSAAWSQIGITRALSDPQNPHHANGVALATNLANNAVIFSTKGTASPAGTVTLRSTNYTGHVTVILAGRIRSG
ncbi:MAG TPA: GspH/FimT family protein [Syntrophorhabdales bacterium]|nr:GspH/FimT family protein [Syntrophorhabdales bacterium]